MSLHMAYLIPHRHLLANQSKIPLMFFVFARFPYPVQRWANFNRVVILERLTSLGLHKSCSHPALHPWGDCCPLNTSRVSLFCCAQPNFSTLIRVRFCHLWDFNHYSLQCQRFSKEIHTLYKGVQRKEWKTTPGFWFYWDVYIYMKVNNFKDHCLVKMLFAHSFLYI